MAQINHLLRELWTRVYMGNDIETIKIKWALYCSLVFLPRSHSHNPVD